ncbi:MAG: hypothetical protein JNL21_03655 [Myxococcales bacterium]|nr:hypothetical protein [Myxococcales bacterium]
MAELSLVRIAAFIGVGGSLLAVAVPAFVRGLSASKLTEALEGLHGISAAAVSKAETHRHEESFPPSVGRTPEQVPRGVAALDPPGTWDHLTWRALDFKVDRSHAFSFQFDSAMDPVSLTARFSATAHGDLDGDGQTSTFQVQGERRPGEPARVLPGMLINREYE